jgi:cytochrome b
MQRILVWDWPTRLIHWLLVLLVFFSWGSAEYGQMELHRYSGYTVLGLLIFRIYWGMFGSETARFARFVKGPATIMNYVRGRADSVRVGHNPLGALSVIVLLGLLITQVTLGVFAVDIDGLESGPLSHLVSFEIGRAFAKWHENVFDALLIFIVLHVAAVLCYLFFKRTNLIGPMITGKKEFASPVNAKPVSASFVRIVIGAAVAGAVVWFIV